jgi:SAM-dependent methyltransferase
MLEDAHRVWAGSMPELYDRLLGPAVFAPFAGDLAQRIAEHQPGNVLELAAGTGQVTRELVRALPAAHLVATDLNAAMVAQGALLVPQADWQQADAQRLSFPDSSFDLIACQFGVMFFPDRPIAFAGARRVLRPGGRLLFNTWGALPTHEFGTAVVAALRQIFPTDPPTFLDRVPHGYADPDRITAELAAGGLHCASIVEVTLSGAADSAASVARGFCVGTPLRGEIEARGQLAATTEAVESLVTAAMGSGPVTGTMTALVCTASIA